MFAFRTQCDALRFKELWGGIHNLFFELKVMLYVLKNYEGEFTTCTRNTWRGSKFQYGNNTWHWRMRSDLIETFKILEFLIMADIFF